MDISFCVPLSPGREVVMQEYAHEPLPPCSCSQNGGKLCWHQVVGCLKQSTEFQFHLNRTLSTVTATEHSWFGFDRRILQCACPSHVTFGRKDPGQWTSKISTNSTNSSNSYRGLQLTQGPLSCTGLFLKCEQQNPLKKLHMRDLELSDLWVNILLQLSITRTFCNCVYDMKCALKITCSF